MTPAHKEKLEEASRDEVNHYLDAGLLHHDAIRRAIKSFEVGKNERTKTSSEYKEFVYAIAYLKKQLTTKSKKMATKKATPAQLAARKKFAQMAKDGTLAKKRKAAAKKGLNSFF